MIDLRNTKTANLKINPRNTRHKDFNLALADYLTKELRKRGLTISKLNDLAVRIHVGKSDRFKYHSMVIDCLDGNMYVVDKRNKERRVGKLLSFNGTRSSDAFNCLKRSIYKILRKVNTYTIEDQLLHEASPIDLRRKIIISDLRRKIIISDLRRKNVIVSDLRKRNKIIDLRGMKTSPNKIESALLSISEIKKAKDEVSYISNNKTLFDTAKNVFNSGINMFKRLLKR